MLQRVAYYRESFLLSEYRPKIRHSTPNTNIHTLRPSYNTPSPNNPPYTVRGDKPTKKNENKWNEVEKERKSETGRSGK